MSDIKKYAEAIASRIADEWSGKNEFPEDALLLQEILTKLFLKHPKEAQKLVGTGIIEENYFEKL